MFCPKCGYVADCPNCSVKLTYHRKAAQLTCHLCGEIRSAPKVCPNPDCRDPAIRYAGMGTEKVESAIHAGKAEGIIAPHPTTVTSFPSFTFLAWPRGSVKAPSSTSSLISL